MMLASHGVSSINVVLVGWLVGGVKPKRSILSFLVVVLNVGMVVSIERSSSSSSFSHHNTTNWFYNKSIGGVTQLLFSPTNGYNLFSAVRRSNTILLWDIRYNNYPMGSDTNQRIEFDVDENGPTLYVGGVDSMIWIYDNMFGHCIEQIQHDQFVNGISYRHSRSRQGKDNWNKMLMMTMRRSIYIFSSNNWLTNIPPDHVHDGDNSDSRNGDHSSSIPNRNSSRRHHNHDPTTKTCHPPSLSLPDSLTCDNNDHHHNNNHKQLNPLHIDHNVASSS